MNGGNKLLYHGSSKDLDILKPMASKVIDGEAAVFATNAKFLAIIFIASNATDSDIDIGFIHDVPYILEQWPGAFDKFLKGRAGYLYYVNAENFHSDKRLGMHNHEFISNNDEKILKKERIEDIYEALLKTDVNIVDYDSKMECIYNCITNKKVS